MFSIVFTRIESLHLLFAFCILKYERDGRDPNRKMMILIMYNVKIRQHIVMQYRCGIFLFCFAGDAVLICRCMYRETIYEISHQIHLNARVFCRGCIRKYAANCTCRQSARVNAKHIRCASICRSSVIWQHLHTAYSLWAVHSVCNSPLLAFGHQCVWLTLLVALLTPDYISICMHFSSPFYPAQFL